MDRGKYIAPQNDLEAFTCPRCQTLASQSWDVVKVRGHEGHMKATRCFSCGKFSIWEWKHGSSEYYAWRLSYPDVSPAPLPNADLPEDVLADYVEAADIFNRSPKGAAALLRLAVQKLCKHLGQPGKNINNDIGELVKQGLSPIIQQAMDTVRITGNEAVHPGEINLEDDGELALALFDFVNLIAEDRITTPKKVQEMYERLPQGKRDGVDQRDST